MVSHNPSSDLDSLCEIIRNNVDLSSFTHFEFDNLGKIEKSKVEKAIYSMMTTFKKTPLEIANSIPKSLYDKFEQKLHYCLDTEKKIRETTLAEVMPKLSKTQCLKPLRNMLSYLYLSIGHLVYY